MQTHFLVLLFILTGTGAFGATLPKSVTLGKSFSQTLHVQNLARAAVANSKIAKVKAIPPSTLLITAMQPGKTMLRYWTT